MIPPVQGRAGEPLRLKGTAYDFGHRIAAIQFSLDEGENWTTQPTDGTNDYQTVTWTFDFTPPRAGMYRMQVRSVNERGEASPHPAFIELDIR